MSENKLPTLAQLHQSPEEAFKYDKYLALVNQPPHEKWVKTHPMFKNKYIPIDKVEYLLKRIFQQYKIEVLREGVMLNSAYVVVRVNYLHPVTGEWSYHDGVGAKAFQLDSGSAASDLTAIKPEAVMMALPIAKSTAIKDACDHLGKLFGGDLNRKDTLRFKGGYIVDTDEPESTTEETPTPKRETTKTKKQPEAEDADFEDLPL